MNTRAQLDQWHALSAEKKAKFTKIYRDVGLLRSDQTFDDSPERWTDAYFDCVDKCAEAKARAIAACQKEFGDGLQSEQCCGLVEIAYRKCLKSCDSER